MRSKRAAPLRLYSADQTIALLASRADRQGAVPDRRAWPLYCGLTSRRERCESTASFSPTQTTAIRQSQFSAVMKMTQESEKIYCDADTDRNRRVAASDQRRRAHSRSNCESRQ